MEATSDMSKGNREASSTERACLPVRDIFQEDSARTQVLNALTKPLHQFQWGIYN